MYKESSTLEIILNVYCAVHLNLVAGLCHNLPFALNRVMTLYNKFMGLLWLLRLYCLKKLFGRIFSNYRHRLKAIKILITRLQRLIT